MLSQVESVANNGLLLKELFDSSNKNNLSTNANPVERNSENKDVQCFTLKASFHIVSREKASCSSFCDTLKPTIIVLFDNIYDDSLWKSKLIVSLLSVFIQRHN